MTKSRSSGDRQPSPAPSSQHQRFIETARALECDEDKERFEEKLKQIATAKPSSRKSKKAQSD
jgi:hypothetical protein